MTLLVVDGNSIFNRAFYGIKLLTTKDGRYTNAIYGFLTMLEKIKETVLPDNVAIAFDMRAKTFRHEMYSEYKAQRKGMPPELAMQFPILKELLTLLGYKIVECEGYEADDILGTLADECEKTGNKCVIATGDRDSLQLVGENVSVNLAVTKMGHPETTLYDTQKVLDEYGVTPEQLIDVKALQGDTSDNIPGVSGIGKKGASDLIKNFGSIKNIYDNISTIDIRETLRTKLIEGKDKALISYDLGKICKSAPIDRNFDNYTVSPVKQSEAYELMFELELFSLIKKLQIQPTEEVANEKSESRVLDYVECSTFPKKLDKAYFVTKHNGNKVENIYLVDGNTVNKITPTDEVLKNFLSDGSIKKYTTNVKTLFKSAIELGVDLNGVEFDIELSGYLLDPSQSNYSIERLLDKNGILLPEIKDVSDNEIRSYATLPTLVDKLTEQIEANGQMSLLLDIEIPLARVLAEMESLGIAVNAQGIKEYGVILEEKIEELKAQIFGLCNYTFNINSPKQLGEALFKWLGLPSGKKTKTGYSTSAEVLEGLRYSHPVIPLILEYRMLSKLKSTYCDSLLKVISEDGRIHSSFIQTETRTGRISSVEPNLQNIPVRTEQGREFRKFFVAKEGCVLIDADYSQIELRVLAHIADDKNMIEGFNSEQDIHSITASQVFGVPQNMVTPIMRSRAKAVNFGIVYGIGAFSLSKDINVTRKEADNYIKSYLAHYSGVAEYMDNVVERAKETQYVSTLLGRRRYLHELSSSNHALRSFGERVARNMPIQGTAADIIKIAMIRVSNRLKEEGMKAKLILQVHDELIVEAPIDEAERVSQLLRDEMENAFKMSVPLVADAAIGATWFEAKK